MALKGRKGATTMAKGTEKATRIGDNVEAVIDGDKLIITMDMSEEGHPSQSGKSITIATTGGNTTIGQTGLKLGLNLTRPVAVAQRTGGLDLANVDPNDLAKALQAVQSAKAGA